MAESETSLLRFYQGWEAYQGELAAAVRPLSAEQLALRAAPNQRSLGVIAGHIISARVWCFHVNLGEGDPALAPLEHWDEVDPVRQTGAELASGLDATWRLIADCLARWTPADLDQTVRGVHRDHHRGWVLWHVLEHDLHHGGEFFLTCGMHGLAVPDL